MKTLMTLAFGLTTLLIMGAGGCSQQEQTHVTRNVVSVKARVVERSDLELSRTYTGSLVGEKQAFIYAKLAEAVEKVHVAEGDRVTKDQVLVSLDKYGSSSRYNEVLSLYRNSEKNERKMAYLYEEGAISESQYDAARTEFEVNQANFEAVSRLVDVRTPIAGVVTSVGVSEGEFVGAGQRLATVATTERLKVRFGVNAEEIGAFTVGAQVAVRADVGKASARGTISAVASSADPATRAFDVEAVFDNGDGRFRPGMFVRIQHIQDRLERQIVVPRRSILDVENVLIAYIVVDGKAVRREVSLGPDADGSVVIRSGLNAGDTLVTLGQAYLDDGFEVNITELQEGA